MLFFCVAPLFFQTLTIGWQVCAGVFFKFYMEENAIIRLFIPMVRVV
jgi:hypothetical protein